ncbi:bifunctional TH2 protein, mitochondrial-like isoform X4 [Cynara cardunculus var. scolymus]|uniref:bifunctional TH2 protein, mitochondrial-like isoform X4 n=1 Tax=Cynara cardunculus var. scolymus TaxID=59895 RepID=UPI000D628830|nr:bifunctional TH2 protein, mitochondrial-like isoform X4 [Cynara cardunculus var. scolymus]
MGGLAIRDEGGIAKSLWKKSRNESIFAIYTPYILSLASGKLDSASFLHCISQDLRFLQASAEAFEMAEECSDDDDDKAVIRKVRKRVLKKMAMFRLIVQEWGFELPAGNISDRAMVKCTDFLLATASGKAVGERFPVCLTGEELQFVENIYQKAMKLQVEFFSAQPIIQNTIVPLYRAHGSDEHNFVIFSGFDMTCSAVDSCALLADIAIIKSSKAIKLNGYESLDDGASSDDLRDIWSSLHGQYVEEYEQCIDSIMLSDRVTQFNFESLCNALGQLSELEKAANLRVANSGVLKGLHMDEIKWAGEHLVFQDGCLEFFREIEKSKDIAIDVHILSYCWSGDLIRSAFRSASGFPNVHSNELLFDESISTGEILKRVQNPTEKLQTFNEICKMSSNNGRNLSVYIGGSVEDLLCLLKADIGVVISPSANLTRLAGLFGFSFVPLFSGLVKKQRELIEGGCPCWSGLSGTLYTVSSWAEIHAFILGT